MARDNTPVFIPHTAANVEQTQRAIELGARHATHFYDVFPCPPVVDPGVRPCGAVEAILADERVSVDFILDGVHVDPVAIKMAGEQEARAKRSAYHGRKRGGRIRAADSCSGIAARLNLPTRVLLPG